LKKRKADEYIAKKSTLVLNKQWSPLSVETVKKSITKISKGVAVFVEPETDMAREDIDSNVLDAFDDDEKREAYILSFPTRKELDEIWYEEIRQYGKNVIRSCYNTYRLEEWMELPCRPHDRKIHVGNGANLRSMRCPEIVQLIDYSELPLMQVRLTKSNMLIRDNYSCQYCGTKVLKNKDDQRNEKAITWDHVVPRAKGGKSSWENLVICCKKCNTKKADKTLKEANLVLLKNPLKPNLHPLYCKTVRNKPASWDKFLDKAKWDDYHKYD
jgi:5-methylcytosine-specific restriction endonuclease McrA